MTASKRVVEKVVHMFALGSNSPRSRPLIADVTGRGGSSEHTCVAFSHVIDELRRIVGDENLVLPSTVLTIVPSRGMTFGNVVAKVSSEFRSQSDIPMEPFL